MLNRYLQRRIYQVGRICKVEEELNEWEAGRRYFSQASMAALYGIRNGQETSPEEVLTG